MGVSKCEEERKFQVTIEVYGRSYVLTKSAPTYIDMVRNINQEFGQVLITKTVDLD